jgi:hypothetical protein
LFILPVKLLEVGSELVVGVQKGSDYG